MVAQPDAVSTIVAALIGLIAVIIFMAARPQEERRFLLPLGMAAFTLKAILVPLYYFLLVNAGLDGFAYSDSYEYHLDGIEIARELSTQLDYSSRAWVTVDPGFPILTGIFYWIAGPNTLVVRMFNCMFATFMLLYVYRTSRLFFEEEKIARIACLLVAFLPYSMTIAINHRKEPLVTLLSIFIFYHASRLIRLDRSWATSALLAALGLFAIFFFRSGFVLPFIGILFLCYVTSSQSTARSIALAIPTILILAAVQFFISDDVSISIASSSERVQGKIFNSAEMAEVGGLARFARMTSIFQIYKLPLATVLALILPFPPYLSGLLPAVLLSWTNLLNLAFLPQMIGGGMAVFREPGWKTRIPILLFPGVFLILIGATHLGVARYRETIFPALLILVAVGIHRGTSIFLRGTVYGTLGALAFIVYLARFG